MLDTYNPIRRKLHESIKNSWLPNYIYGYPPKRAYRKFEVPIDLTDIWNIRNEQVNLYIHIPFCNYKCTYCTLLSAKVTNKDIHKEYISSLIREIKFYGKLVGSKIIDSVYIGGGTPTVLSIELLDSLFDTIRKSFPNISSNTEFAIEGSPDSLDEDKLNYLKSVGINRISMGIQTFNEEELKKTGRPYSMDIAIKAINNINKLNFKNFNIDLIYGLENQTKDSWLYSLNKVIQFRPNSINLYPVVFRPLSGIQKARENNKNFLNDTSRYELYDLSIEYMTNNGYRQETFVSFTNLDVDGYKQQVSDFQGNPLIGCGVGARSYTGNIHYSTDYVVTKESTLKMISNYINNDFKRLIEYGFVLNRDEQKRRYIILNLLINKLNYFSYKQIFNQEIFDEFKLEFDALEQEECIQLNRDNGDIRLTRKGFKYSNIIGSLFYSENVNNLEKNFKDK